MLNFLNKTTPLILVSLLATTSGFSQDPTTFRSQKKGFDQGLELPVGQTQAAHNYPARQEVRGPLDVNISSSYLFWQARQQNMDLGIISNTTNPMSTPDSVLTISHADFKYKSGFKVGVGINLNHDNWDTYAEYTWFQGTTKTSLPKLTSGVLFPTQGTMGSNLSNNLFTSATQSWNLKMDFADVSLARSYYSGTKLTLRPFVGARGAWIRQKQEITYIGSSNFEMAQQIISQGVGPRTGIHSNWLLGYGVRLIGKASGDILYTRYSYKLNQEMNAIKMSLSEKHNDFLKAHSELELGFGWGSYFDNHNWFIDLSATYGFQVFWNQNMFRTNTSNGDLSIHGLTLNAKIDF